MIDTRLLKKEFMYLFKAGKTEQAKKKAREITDAEYENKIELAQKWLHNYSEVKN